MEKCNKCGNKGEIVKPGLRCRNCVNEYKNEWARIKKNKKCVFCDKPFIPNGIAKECSLICRIKNRIEKKDGCWIWKGKVTNSGYGEITYNRKYLSVHRISYETFVGKIPEKMNVCHKCDNRKCCNPEHLWLGTHKENMEDMFKKNRQKKGKSSGI